MPVRIVGTVVPFFQDVLIWRPAVATEQHGFGYQSLWDDIGLHASEFGEALVDLDSDGFIAPEDYALDIAARFQIGTVPMGIDAVEVGSASMLGQRLLLAARSPVRSAMAVSVNGATDMIIVGDESQRMRSGPHFAPGVRVFVGQAEADVLAISVDGRFLRVQSPKYIDVCGLQGSLCSGPSAYRPIRIENPPAARIGALQDLPAWEDPLLRYDRPIDSIDCRAEDASNPAESRLARPINVTLCDPQVAVFGDKMSAQFWRDASLTALAAAGLVTQAGNGGILDATMQLADDSALGASIQCPRDCPGLQENELLAFPPTDIASFASNSTSGARGLGVQMTHDTWLHSLSGSASESLLQARGPLQPEELLQGFYYTS